MLKNKKLNYFATLLLLVLCPVLCIYLSNYILRQGLVVTIKYLLPRWKVASAGYIFLFFGATIITAITRKVSIAYLLLGAISIIGAGGHYFKVFFRGEALFPSDITFLRSASGLLNQFNIELTQRMKISIIILAVSVIVSAFFTLPKLKNGYISNIITAIFLSFCYLIFSKTCLHNTSYYEKINISENTNPIDTYYSNTFHTAYLFLSNAMLVEEPSGYSKEAVMEIILEKTSEESYNTPDIIFIMMESWFDPQQLFGLNFDKSINENYK